MAFFQELPRTNNLFARDRAGRTVLELAVQMAVELIQSCYSTSFPVDHLLIGKHAVCTCATCSHRRHYGMVDAAGGRLQRHAIKNPSRVRYNEMFRNMYLQPKEMRLYGSGAQRLQESNRWSKFYPLEFPPDPNGGSITPILNQVPHSKEENPDGGSILRTKSSFKSLDYNIYRRSKQSLSCVIFNILRIYRFPLNL